jgi:hypothetical protein
MGRVITSKIVTLANDNDSDEQETLLYKIIYFYFVFSSMETASTFKGSQLTCSGFQNTQEVRKRYVVLVT